LSNYQFSFISQKKVEHILIKRQADGQNVAAVGGKPFKTVRELIAGNSVRFFAKHVVFFLFKSNTICRHFFVQLNDLIPELNLLNVYEYIVVVVLLVLNPKKHF
jgi:hypothetical protein